MWPLRNGWCLKSLEQWLFDFVLLNGHMWLKLWNFLPICKIQLRICWWNAFAWIFCYHNDNNPHWCISSTSVFELHGNDIQLQIKEQNKYHLMTSCHRLCAEKMSSLSQCVDLCMGQYHEKENLWLRKKKVKGWQRNKNAYPSGWLCSSSWEIFRGKREKQMRMRNTTTIVAEPSRSECTLQT